MGVTPLNCEWSKKFPFLGVFIHTLHTSKFYIFSLIFKTFKNSFLSINRIHSTTMTTTIFNNYNNNSLNLFRGVINYENLI